MRRSVRVTGMQLPRRRAAARQRDVERLGGELLRERAAPRARRGAHRWRPSSADFASLIALPAAGISAGGSLPSSRSWAVNSALLAEELHADGIERGQVFGRAHGRFGLAQQFRDAAHRELLDVRRSRRPARASFAAASQGGEALLVVHRDVGEDLAIDLDLGEREPVHQAAVRQPVRARRGVDARDPQRAELALAHAAVAERVLPRLDDGLLRGAEDLAVARCSSPSPDRGSCGGAPWR